LRQSGKNSADIRLVVDALDLCYTKPHIDSFVIISGDSDFSPLVSKLRENNKTVIGVGVKNSTSDLLTANCHEFIYYDDLIRESDTQKKAQRKRSAGRGKAKAQPDSAEGRKQEAFDLVIEVVEDLVKERGEEDKIWGSMVKQTLKRRKPGFNESYHGFRSFSELLEEAQSRKLLLLEHDERSGGYIIRHVTD
ncbi:MAG: NYN domain-containing protein, partial [Bacteroidota bacterium]